MKIVSELTGKEYDENDVLFFKNAKQSAAYMLNGAMPVDIFPTDDKMLEFVFLKEDHIRLRDKWKNHEL